VADEGLLQQLFNESFPSVSPKTRARFRSFLASDSLDHKWMYEANLHEDISQGDIFTAIPSFFFDNGKIKTSKPCPFIMFSHTCDMAIDDGEVRNQHYVFAPLFPYTLVERYCNSDAIKRNLITHKMCFNSVPNLEESHVADLNMIGSVNAEWFHKAENDSDIVRIASLSEPGFYFLLAKLTVHLLRAS